jgi:hypothetical protein
VEDSRTVDFRSWREGGIVGERLYGIVVRAIDINILLGPLC